MMRNTLITAAITAAAATSAGAATISSVLPYSSSDLFQAPEETLVLDWLQTGSADGKVPERSIEKNRDNAQSFQMPSAAVIDKIVINFTERRTSSTGASTTFEFFRVADADDTELTPDGDIIDSFTFDSSDAGFGGLTAGTMIIDVADTAAAAGDAFAIRFDTAASTNYSIKWKILHDSRPGDWEGGRSYESNNTNNKIYTLGIIAVPEPASLSLLGLAGLGLTRRAGRFGCLP